MINRTDVAQALAKAIAYKHCGKDRDAEEWARRLVELLECADILRPEEIDPLDDFNYVGSRHHY